jgi:hypothetical protein
MVIALVLSGCGQGEMEPPIQEPEPTVKLQVRATTVQRPPRSATFQEIIGAPPPGTDAAPTSVSLGRDAFKSMSATETISARR